jgi:tetratricopeptide (TPR) repeat protein
MFAFPRRRAAIAAAFLAASLLQSGARAQQSTDEADDDDTPSMVSPGQPQAPAPALPVQELTGQTLAAQTFLELSKRTRDPRIARRAVEVANMARMPLLALESARIWHEADPASAQALQAVTVLLVAAKRVDEAEPYLAKLLEANQNAAANGFMQLARLLAGNPDPAANLRVVRNLAARYPKLPQARFAIAQAAAAANDEAEALAQVRGALELRPDWEVAAMYEAQLLQRRSPGEAARRLAAYLEKYPDSRDIRLGHARLLVLDKRFPEARAEFEAILKRFPKDIDAVYAVGLLAFQAKEYAVAEANMKRLLELGYRDANAVRFTLGQIAEEQNDWPRAIQWYGEIQRGDQALPARMRTAFAIAKQGKLAEARAYLHGLKVQAEPQRVQLLVAESQLLRDANMHREAFDLLGQALQKTPDQPDLLYDQALTAEKIERFDVLEANLRTLIKEQPDHAHAYNALGYSFADRNMRLDEARALIERALELAPNDAFIVDSMGWVLYRQGDTQAAVAQLRRAWSLRPDAEIGAHLGEVLWVAGDHKEANRVWDEALREHPDNETLLKTLRRFRP